MEKWSLYKIEWIQKEIEDNGACYIQKSFYRHLWASNKAKFTVYMPVESAERLRGTRFYKYSLFLELIIYYVDFFIKIVE